jgi:asparagine synthase (glutamine-hydrolysing)
MCGFLGFVSTNGQAMKQESLDHFSKTLDTIYHRGPDDDAQSSGEGWWMGFRRLAILDLSLAGRQPMAFRAGRYKLVFNGEIYNFRKLKEELDAKLLPSSGDTVVLGELLSQQPAEDVLNKLRGMFAFAWYDTSESKLLLARDHFGIKPLYYCLTAEGSLYYGSELRAVAKLAGVSLSLSKVALSDYLKWGSVQAPYTMLEGVKCLPPGHYLHWESGHIKIKRYYTALWPEDRLPTKSWEDQVAMTREVVLDSVSAHLVSDVPVGVFLSGGLDSSLMAACMKHLGQKDLLAFSIGYESDAGVMDESVIARRSAEFFDCKFYSEQLNAATLYAKLDGYFNSLDQPSGDALNTYLASSLAAQNVKVTLSGLGADEWFAGYNYHRLIALGQRTTATRIFVSHLTGTLVQTFDALLPTKLRGHAGWKVMRYMSGAAGSDVARQHAGARQMLSDEAVESLLGHEQETRTIDISHADWLKELLLRETHTYLPNTLLRDNDVTSMAHSLELRVPLVDKEVFQLAGQISSDAKLNLRQGKRVLRAAFRDLLPPWINEDAQKKTFTLPLMKWMREPKWQERIRDTLAADEGKTFEPTATRQITQRYFSDRTNSKAGWHLSQPVWMLFVLAEWKQRNLA